MADHLNLINLKLLDLAAGRINRLIINMPPQHGKSELISKYFPVWYLGHNPDDNIILVSYQTSYAAEWGKKSKDLFSDISRSYFGIDIEKRFGSAYKWHIKGKKGGMKSTGIGGDLTGRGADVLIFDDPIKNESEALSPVIREKVWNFFRATAYTRLSPKGKVIVVMTRWHFDDLVGRILDNQNEFGNWEVLSLPAIAVEDNDIIGRMKGEALFPQRYDINNLLDKQKTLGHFWFSAEYQQQPIASEYQIFRNDRWKFYYDKPNVTSIIQVWDTAFKSGEENDYSVCATWGISNQNYYLLDLWRGKVKFPDLEIHAVNQYKLWKPNLILIEDSASGQDLIPVLRRDTLLPIKPVAPMNKVIRAHAVSPVIEQGNVYIPEQASWLPEFLNEHSQFPYGKNDDIVDTTTIFLHFFRKSGKGTSASGKSAEKKVKNRRFEHY